MIQDLSIVTKEDLLSALLKGGILKTGESVQFESYPANSDRKDSRQKLAFRVRKGGVIAFHLTIGSSLKALHEKTSSFAKANPDIACKPLFFIQDEFDLLGQEYFGETNLEDSFTQKKIDATEWRKAVAFIKFKLEATRRSSSTRELLNELAAIEGALLDAGRFSPFDQTFLREVIFPVVRSQAAEAPAQITWTNGDFIAKNILCDGKGGYRLIDYEFARETHFGELDWFRLQRHSHAPPAIDMAGLSRIPAWPPWLEMLGWLEQALRLGEVSLTANSGYERVAEKLIGLLGSETPFTQRSVFAQALGRAEKQFQRTRLELEAHITLLDATIAQYEKERAGIIEAFTPTDLSEAALRIRSLEEALAVLRQKHDLLIESLQKQNEVILDYERPGGPLTSSGSHS